MSRGGDQSDSVTCEYEVVSPPIAGRFAFACISLFYFIDVKRMAQMLNEC